MQPNDPPQNGIQGLKHWRYDLLAGMQVALVSMPLSLGIAIASGAPPITGIVSAVIAGLIFPFLGGAYVTISGPAAGLAPALLAGMLLLGGGDLTAGYPLILVAICLTGLVQIVLSLFKAGRFAIFLPVTVVEAMLAAIGLLIIIKQIPPLLGTVTPPTKNMLLSVASLPESVLAMNPAIFSIGAICLFLMFYLNRSRQAWARRVPAPLAVAVVGIVLGFVFQLDARYLISMPDDLLEGGITLPAFADVWSRPELWTSVLLVVVTLTLIDGIESLATIKAVDKIDPYQRKSHPNVTLRAMGVSNMLSSIFGGLTIIPGGVKSRANIDAGGRTLWANFYNAMFLILFLLLATRLISRIPLAAIGAILIYVGWRLCEFKVFSKAYAIGRDQIIIFVVTIGAILATDLLYGILIGIAAEIGLLVFLLSPSLRVVLTGRLTFWQSLRLLAENFTGLFRSPIIKVKEEQRHGQPHLQISLGSVVCFNLLALDKLLSRLPDRTGVSLTITESGRIIDHTAMEYLHEFQEESLRAGRAYDIRGLENFYQFTSHSLSARMHDAKLVKEKAKASERELEMAEVARGHGFLFTPDTAGVLNRHDFVYLRRGDNRQESNVMTGTHQGCHVKVFDYSHTAAPDYYAEHWHTLLIFCCLADQEAGLPDMVITPGHYLERYLVGYREQEVRISPLFDKNYRVYGRDGQDPGAFLKPELIGFLTNRLGVYLEVRDNMILVFRPDRELEPKNEIKDLLTLAGILCDGQTTVPGKM